MEKSKGVAAHHTNTHTLLDIETDQ